LEAERFSSNRPSRGIFRLIKLQIGALLQSLFVPAAELYGRISSLVINKHRDNKVIDNFVFLESEQETNILDSFFTTHSGVWLNTKETTVIILDLNG